MPSIEVFALVAPKDPGLLGSYARAYEAMGCSVTWWDPYRAVNRHTRLGPFGRFFTRFVPVDAWLHKANREMVLAAAERSPDLLIVSGNSPVRGGALAQLRIMSPRTKLVLLWPDPLLNLSRHVIESLPVYDLVATYSSSSIAELERLGARRVSWLPFAADPLLFPIEVTLSDSEQTAYECDVAFIGSHRPEREAAIQALIAAGYRVKVWGDTSWRRHSADKAAVRRYYQGRPLFGADFAKALRAAKLSLNPIDPTNFPAANMRFFESAACGAATLNSKCPEVEGMFPHGKTAFYYDSLHGLAETAGQLIEDAPLRAMVARAAQQTVVGEHSYRNRAAQLIQALGV